jgi:hypothetical protein
MRTPTADESQASAAPVGYLGDTGMSFREFAMREPLPLSTIQDAVFEFLQGRDDTVVNERFKFAVWIREVRGGIGFRLYQVRKEGNRHLVDVRPVDTLPPSQSVGNVLVATPAELIAGKLLGFVGRQGKPKAYTDRRDLAVLLLAYPELKTQFGPVRDRLEATGAGAPVLEAWSQLVREEFRPDDEDDEF